jgi:cytochrome c peroxidase
MKSNAHAPRAVLLTLIVVVCSGALQAADAPSGARHGAQDTQLQQQRLDKLLATDGGVPKGIDPVVWNGIYVPADNGLTPERIALGRKLYFDTRLSSDGTVSCATCHDVSRGFTDRRNVSEGVGDHLGRRSSPTTLNAALFQSMFWDGRAPTLEEQAKLPILNPIEMGHPDPASAMRAVGSDALYKDMGARTHQSRYFRLCLD